MSELSTVAIKDGHRGHIHHHHTHQQPNPLDAERADRISRLAGLERITAARHPQTQPSITAPVGYFDHTGTPHLFREKSTVGSASATGSVGGRTTWASGSEVEGDRYSERLSTPGAEHDHVEGDPSEVDMDTSSVGGFSTNTEGAEADSLVAFGEGARTPARRSPGLSKAVPATGGSLFSSHLRDATSASSSAARTGLHAASSPMSGVSSSSATAAAFERNQARMIDGVTYDEGVLDTTTRPPPPVNAQGRRSLSGAETAEHLLGDKLEPTVGRLGSPEETEAGGRSLGRFDFETK